jgi:hypothetical protein
MKFFLIVIFLFCKNENRVSELDELIEKEKFNTAEDKIQTILETKKKSDEVLSSKKPVKNRILEVSNDRNRIVWLEDKQINFRDFANPMSKNLTFPDLPESLSISTEAEYALTSFPLPSGSGCKMVNVSLIEPKPSYFSDTYINCKNRPAVSYDGSTIYYFINDNLYEESIFDPKKPKLLVSKEKFEVVYPNLKNKALIFPIAKSFIIFFGNAGAYILYWFNPMNNSIEKLGTEISSPKLYYANGKSAYLLGGVVGSVYLRELKFTSHGKPTLSAGFLISSNDLNPFPTSQANQFISGKSGSIYKWGPGITKKTLPILAEKFWVVARDFIVYENKKKELILTSTEFTEEDWKILELYNKTKSN